MSEINISDLQEQSTLADEGTEAAMAVTDDLTSVSGEDQSDLNQELDDTAVSEADGLVTEPAAEVMSVPVQELNTDLNTDSTTTADVEATPTVEAAFAPDVEAQAEQSAPAVEAVPVAEVPVEQPAPVINTTAVEDPKAISNEFDDIIADVEAQIAQNTTPAEQAAPTAEVAFAPDVEAQAEQSAPAVETAVDETPAETVSGWRRAPQQTPSETQSVTDKDIDNISQVLNIEILSSLGVPSDMLGASVSNADVQAASSGEIQVLSDEALAAVKAADPAMAYVDVQMSVTEPPVEQAASVNVPTDDVEPDENDVDAADAAEATFDPTQATEESAPVVPTVSTTTADDTPSPEVFDEMMSMDDVRGNDQEAPAIADTIENFTDAAKFLDNTAKVAASIADTTATEAAPAENDPVTTVVSFDNAGRPLNVYGQIISSIVDVIESDPVEDALEAAVEPEPMAVDMNDIGQPEPGPESDEEPVTLNEEAPLNTETPATEAASVDPVAPEDVPTPLTLDVVDEKVCANGDRISVGSTKYSGFIRRVTTESSSILRQLLGSSTISAVLIEELGDDYEIWCCVVIANITYLVNLNSSLDIKSSIKLQDNTPVSAMCKWGDEIIMSSVLNAQLIFEHHAIKPETEVIPILIRYNTKTGQFPGIVKIDVSSVGASVINPDTVQPNFPDFGCIVELVVKGMYLYVGGHVYRSNGEPFAFAAKMDANYFVINNIIMTDYSGENTHTLMMYFRTFLFNDDQTITIITGAKHIGNSYSDDLDLCKIVTDFNLVPLS